MICPFSVVGATDYTPCKKAECAWWIDDERDSGECAIQHLGRLAAMEIDKRIGQ